MSTKDTAVKGEKGESIQIGTLFKFIKSFDGSREKLNSFITNCDNAIDLASDAQKSILFKFILSQLEGKAETACAIKEFESWDQLSDFLKTQFGERKHYAHLLAELQECHQLFSEAVNQFALRVETSLSKLLTEITLSNRKKSELVGRTAAMEDLALHTFLLGLKPNISNLVRGKNPSNLNEAVNLAISEEKIQKLLYKRNLPTSNLASTAPRPIQKPNYSFRPVVHNVNSRPQVFNQNMSNIPFCRYCKTQGHTLETCKKREYNNNRFKVTQPSPQTSYRPTTNQFNNSNYRFSKPQPSRIHYVNDNDYYYSNTQPDDDTTQQYDDITQQPDDQRNNDDHLNE